MKITGKLTSPWHVTDKEIEEQTDELVFDHMACLSQAKNKLLLASLAPNCAHCNEPFFPSFCTMCFL